jgi:hypothetical protein
MSRPFRADGDPLPANQPVFPNKPPANRRRGASPSRQTDWRNWFNLDQFRGAAPQNRAVSRGAAPLPSALSPRWGGVLKAERTPAQTLRRVDYAARRRASANAYDVRCIFGKVYNFQ